jgi:cell division protein ZapA
MPKGEELTRVEIYGQTYGLRGEGNQKYVQDLAAYVDRKMREISEHTTTVDSLKLAVLAAVNIADELHALREQMSQQEQAVLQRADSFMAAIDRCFASLGHGS